MRAVQNYQRLFIAIDLEEQLKHTLSLHTLELQKTLSPNHLRWSKPNQFHVTLKFLGEVSTSAIPALLLQLQTVIATLTSFQLSGDELTIFPNAHPHILAVRVKPDPELLTVQQQIEKACKAQGFHSESRPFLPHITLARTAHHQPLTLSPPQLTLDLHQLVQTITLFSSHISSEGSQYEVLERFSLKSWAAF